LVINVEAYERDGAVDELQENVQWQKARKSPSSEIDTPARVCTLLENHFVRSSEENNKNASDI
jgi:hypothetical protein